MTVRDLINRSLRLIGVIARGETPDAAMAQDALTAMNAMIDSWKNNGFMIYENEYQALTLISGQQTYTLGSGGDFAITRPIGIVKASTVINGIETPIAILTFDEWAKISNKDLSSDIPTKLFYNPASPLGELNIWPKPSSAANVKLYLQKPVEKFANLSTVFELPPGYEDLIVFGTADRIAPEFGKELTPRQLQTLTDVKAEIMRKNTSIETMVCDDTGVSNYRRRFDILTGGYR